MGYNIEDITNESAVKILTEVSKMWFQERGLEANIVLEETRAKSKDYDKAKKWPTLDPKPDDETGQFARYIISTLINSTDEEVGKWTSEAIKEAEKSESHALVDPVSLIIIGGILIGSILAARVKKIGSVEFYKGVPKELEKVLKAAASIQVPK
jgi:hypothetical protein